MEPAIYFMDTSTNATLVDGEYRWDVCGTVEAVRYLDRDVEWSSLSASIVLDRPPYGREYHDEVTYIPPRPVVPRPSEVPEGPTVYFEERAGDPGTVDHGDVIGVAGANRSIQGCSVDFGLSNYRTQYLHEGLYIPVFDERFGMVLGDCSVSAPHAGVHSWVATAPVLSVSPPLERVTWGSIRVYTGILGDETGFIPIPYQAGDETVGPGPVFYYEEQGPGDGFIGPGDVLRVANVSLEWRDCFMGLYTGAVQISATRIGEFFPSPALNLTLGPPTLSEWYNGDGYFSAAEFNVTQVSPSVPTVEWDSLRAQVCDFSYPGRFYYRAPSRTVMEYSAAAHSNGSAFYIDGGAHDGLVSAGDRLLVTDIGAAQAGGLVVVNLEDLLVGSARLPFLLPGIGPIVTFGWGPPVERAVDGVPLYDITMRITGLKVQGIWMPWTQLRVSVVGGGWDSNLTPQEDKGAYGTALQAWYSQGAGGDDRLGPGDSLKITGLNSSRPAVVLTLWFDDHDVGGGAYPDPFDPRTPVDYRSAAVTLGDLSLDYLPVNGTPYWRATVPVRSVAPDGLVLPIVHLRLIVVGNGTYLGFNQTLTVFDPADHPGGWGAFNIDAPRAWFIDVGKADGAVDVGDMIGITGMTEVYEGGYLALWVQNHYTCNLDLPVVFQ